MKGLAKDGLVERRSSTWPYQNHLTPAGRTFLKQGASETTRQRVKRAFVEHPHESHRTLAKRLGISPATLQHHVNSILREK